MMVPEFGRDERKEGYGKQVATISAELDGWYIGNIVFGGLIGMLIVDPATGAMWRLDDSVNASLVENAEGSSELKVMELSQVPDEWKDKLVPVI